MVEQKLTAILITGRTIDQGVGKEMGKGSKEYFDSSSICVIDEADMKKLGIKKQIKRQGNFKVRFSHR